MVTMKQARAEFANRATLKPAEFESRDLPFGETVRVKVKARVRYRRPLSHAGFRAWAAYQYQNHTDLSPKLARIVATRPF
jgi:hypothetical protein